MCKIIETNLEILLHKKFKFYCTNTADKYCGDIINNKYGVFLHLLA